MAHAGLGACQAGEDLVIEGLAADAYTPIRGSDCLPGLNKPCNERCLALVHRVVDGGTVAGVQDLHSEDAHCGRGAHFVGAAEGHVEGQDLIGIPGSSGFFERIESDPDQRVYSLAPARFLVV